MTGNTSASNPVNILIVGQAGRLQYEALLFAASLRTVDHSTPVRLYVAEPQPGALWPEDPRMSAEIRATLSDLGAHHLPFESRVFGARYPNGNKIEALTALPANQPFVFFDTDTVILDDLGQVPFDFIRPSASLRREGTWPVPDLYGPDIEQIWASLYARFDLDFASAQDPAQPKGHWRRYPYYNAGVFYHACPHRFGTRYLQIAQQIETDPPAALTGQALVPWLDQIALPLVIHAFGGGVTALSPGFLDGQTTCHWRTLPLMYAREPDHVIARIEALAQRPDLKPLLRAHRPIQQLIYQRKGAKLRAQFDRNALPRPERLLRHKIKSLGLWIT